MCLNRMSFQRYLLRVVDVNVSKGEYIQYSKARHSATNKCFHLEMLLRSLLGVLNLITKDTTTFFYTEFISICSLSDLSITTFKESFLQQQTLH